MFFRPFRPRTESAAQRKARTTSQKERSVTSYSARVSTVTLTFPEDRTDDKMKEELYGWYPPARSIWDQRKEKSSYHKECLYKHWGSTYNDKSGVASPVPPTPIRAMHPSPISRPASRAASTQPAPEGLSISGSRPPSVGSARVSTSARKQTSSSSSKPRRAAWAARLAATSISVPHYTPISSRPIISVDAVPVLPTATDMATAGSAPGSATSRTRSATARRPRTTPPSRPTRSAGCTREVTESLTQQKEALLAPTPEPQAPAPSAPEAEPSAPSPPPAAPSPPMSSVHSHPRAARPGAPLPPGGGEEYEDSEVESVSGSEPLDYEEQLEKYGWRFEVPGDPYNLKKPCLPVRHPYTVKLPVPAVAPNPPRGHMMNYDTYFLNTIPRKPATFTIHKEWISEVLNAKRLDLQKREGVNYNFKQYAFIY